MEKDQARARQLTDQFWQIESVAQSVGAKIIGPSGDTAHVLNSFRGVTTDSRMVSQGDLFIALAGERFDGHDYLAVSAKAGAAGAVVNEAFRQSQSGSLPMPLLVVPDTLTALQRLASAWRDVLADAGCQVIAIAGSNGKTSTRHLLHQVLQQALQGSQSPKSFNNHIGVPLTLLAAQAEDDYVLVEIGSNHPGEVRQLADMTRPDQAMITSLGLEHLEHFGNLAGVAREELSLLEFVKGDVVLPESVMEIAEQERVSLPARVGAGRVIRCGGSTEAKVRLESRTRQANWRQVMRVDGHDYELPLLGQHEAQNALLVLTMAQLLGLSPAAIGQGFGRAKPMPMRLEHSQIGPIHLINDAYNANPSSFAGLFATLEELVAAERPRHVVLVLGDMLELGEHSARYHNEIPMLCARLARNTNVSVMAIGPAMAGAFEAAQHKDCFVSCQVFVDWQDAVGHSIAAELQPGDWLVLKGSRGMKLERALQPVVEKFGEQT